MRRNAKHFSKFSLVSLMIEGLVEGQNKNFSGLQKPVNTEYKNFI